MENASIGPWKRIKKTIKYDNPWIQISHEEVINPGGGNGIYGVVHFKNLAIGIVPIDNQGYTWLVGQHRYPSDYYSWEIPEGGGPLGVDPLLSAQRELQEEVGITAQTWTPLLHMHLSNSVSDEEAIVFVAQNLSYGSSAPEETEQLTIKKLPLSEAIQMVLDGAITDSISVAALLKLHAMLLKGELVL
jgi:8-oxo-dGTP pyrophosphatase MutT (NUDIX family)